MYILSGKVNWGKSLKVARWEYFLLNDQAFISLDANIDGRAKGGMGELKIALSFTSSSCHAKIGGLNSSSLFGWAFSILGYSNCPFNADAYSSTSVATASGNEGSPVRSWLV